jgi:glycosyltransferase involved in cell wall biosynthesis
VRPAVRRLGTAATRPLLGPQVLRRPWAVPVWARLLGSPLVPQAQRAATARTVAGELQALGRPGDAATVLERAAATVTAPLPRAELALAAAQQRLDLGEPAPGLAGAVQQALAQADRVLAAGRPKEAAELLTRAAAVTFHRALHFDGPSSPLAADPAEYLAAWHASACYARLTAPAGRSDDAPSPGPVDRPRRLLFVTFKNWNFLEPLAAHYEERARTAGDVEVRRLDLAAVAPGRLPLSPLQQIRARLTGALPPAVAEVVAPEVAWADTVFVDWCQRAAVLVTALDPGSARVVVRLHSFEAFTVFPHLVDPSRVDDFVVVGSHIGRLAAEVVPGLAGGGPGAPAVTALPNVLDLGPFDLPKDDDARLTLAVVGYAAAAKDALWAVDVLAELRRTDPRYRLLLVGHDVPDEPDTPASVRAYGRALAERTARDDVAGAVERVPFTRDVPQLLRRVGVLVSSSVRESFHQAVVEGAASRAVPVVRRWPLLARYGGPGELFPADWLVDSPAQAAARVLATTGDAARWRAEGEAARRQVLETVDFAAVRHRYDDLLLAPRAGRTGNHTEDRQEVS